MTATVITGFAETAELNGSYDVVAFSGSCYSSVRSSSSRIAMLAESGSTLPAKVVWQLTRL